MLLLLFATLKFLAHGGICATSTPLARDLLGHHSPNFVRRGKFCSLIMLLPDVQLSLAVSIQCVLRKRKKVK